MEAADWSTLEAWPGVAKRVNVLPFCVSLKITLVFQGIMRIQKMIHAGIPTYQVPGTLQNKFEMS